MDRSITERVLIDCTLARWDGTAEKVCRWCGNPVKGRARWCPPGDDEPGCCTRFLRNHMWSVARDFRIRVDGWACVKCGHVGWREAGCPLYPVHEDRIVPTAPDQDAWAIAMGLLTREQIQDAWELGWQDPRYREAHAALKAARAAVNQHPGLVVLMQREHQYRDTSRVRWGARHELEVNHKVPREGRGYSFGCAHHQQGLETLCRPCHVLETTAQRRERRDGA